MTQHFRRRERAVGFACAIALLSAGAWVAGGSPAPLRLSSVEASPAVSERASRGSVYVPAYSSIRAQRGGARIQLATTLSIHNPSRDSVLHLQRVDYHNTEGELIQAHLQGPVTIKPLAAVEFFVNADDLRGGSGANFIVEWTADRPVAPPIVEAVMIGMQGSQTYSFVSQGRVVGGD